MRALESAHSEVQSALEGTHSHDLNYIFFFKKKYVLCIQNEFEERTE